MRRLTLGAVIGGVALAGWIGWGIYTTRSAESVPYEHLRTVEDVEIRRYPQLVLATTTAPTQRTAFRRLFTYITGANRGEQSLSMTTPVETRSGDSISMTSPVRSGTTGTEGEVQMSFYLPAEYDPETAPEPTESAVSLSIEPPKRVAVRQFSWYAPEWRVERQQQKLLSTLETEGIDPQGQPALLRYNDPWTPPFMRRNEVLVEIDGHS